MSDKLLTSKEKYAYYEYIYKRKLHRSATWASLSSFAGVFALSIYLLCHLCFSDKAVSSVYTDKIFYYINYPLAKLFGYIPFSVAELLLYVFIICTVVFLFKTIYATVETVMLYFRMKKQGYYPERRSMLRPAGNLGLRFVSVFCIIVTVFIFFGGINYTGMTFSEKAEYTADNYTVEQLRQFCYIMGKNVSETRQALETKIDGSIDEAYSEYNPYKLVEEAKKAYNLLPQKYNSSHTDYPTVKFAYSSIVMSNIHITGIYPYVLPEAIVNIHTPIMSLPHTICHEMAHQRGFAREDEANFIAYMACLQSDNPIFAYSAYYTAFSYAMDELRYYDTKTWTAIMDSVDKNVKKDISCENAYWSQFETLSHEFTSGVNDTYLSVMNVEDGVKNYGKVVELLLAEAIQSGVIK